MELQGQTYLLCNLSHLSLQSKARGEKIMWTEIMKMKQKDINLRLKLYEEEKNNKILGVDKIEVH